MPFSLCCQNVKAVNKKHSNVRFFEGPLHGNVDLSNNLRNYIRQQITWCLSFISAPKSNCLLVIAPIRLGSLVKFIILSDQFIWLNGQYNLIKLQKLPNANWSVKNTPEIEFDFYIHKYVREKVGEENIIANHENLET